MKIFHVLDTHELVDKLFLFFGGRSRVSSCSSGWPWTHSNLITTLRRAVYGLQTNWVQSTCLALQGSESELQHNRNTKEKGTSVPHRRGLTTPRQQTARERGPSNSKTEWKQQVVGWYSSPKSTWGHAPHYSSSAGKAGKQVDKLNLKRTKHQQDGSLGKRTWWTNLKPRAQSLDPTVEVTSESHPLRFTHGPQYTHW